MIEFIFTIDYEIYGNGLGSLKDLVYEPAEKLIEVFQKKKATAVFFVEVAELEMIDLLSTDPYLKKVKEQLKASRPGGFEIGLHLHPQWYKAKFNNGFWTLNYDEYNLCLLKKERIQEILARALSYLRHLIDDDQFVPAAFRAGNWLINPARNIAPLLVSEGIKIDSSVFMGGLQHFTQLDYRRAPKNLYFWRFTEDAIRPDPSGQMLEIPIHTRMIPTWKFLRGKRLNLEKYSPSKENFKQKLLKRAKDFLRWRVPLKFDFCRLNFQELVKMTEEIIKLDSTSPQAYKPIVLIGHTKDNPDISLIENLLAFLNDKGIRTSSFQETYRKISHDR